MPGFFVSNTPIAIRLENMYQDRCLEERINATDCTVMRNTLVKFLDDKAFFETERLIVVTEGFLLNKKVLFAKYNVTSSEQLIEVMYDRNGDEFFSEFRGGFSGAVFDKIKNKWLIWTNYTGVSAVYYSIFAGGGNRWFAGQLCY